MKFQMSDAFWQQDIQDSNFSQWFVRRSVGSTCSLLCGILHIVLGVLTLFIMKTCVETEAVSYTVLDAEKEVELVIPEEMSAASVVYMHVQVDSLYANYRTFTSSKDNHIAGASSSSFDCLGGDTLQDFTYMRGLDFLLSPPPKYLNLDGFFDTTHPLRDQARNLDTLGTVDIHHMDILRHRNLTTEPWQILQVNPSSGITIDDVRALPSNFVQGNSSTIRPCGLNSFSLLFDQVELVHPNGTTLPLDESNLAWNSDIDFIHATKKGIFKGLHLWDGQDEEREISLGEIGEHVVSWLRGSLEADGAHLKDAAFQRLLSWYRNSANPEFRLLLGTYNRLSAGTYKLRFAYVDSAWDSWGAERKIILSTLSYMGSYNIFLPVTCIGVGAVQLLFALFLRVYHHSHA